MTKRTFCLKFIPLLVLIHSCAGPAGKELNTQYYSIEDFSAVEKFDTHVHVNTYNPALIEYAKKNNFRLLSLNVAAPDYPSLEQQQEFTTFHLKKYPGEFAYATSFDINHFNEAGWQEKTIAYLKTSFSKGAIGVKVWKNIGMEYKDENGKFVMIDNPRLDTIFDFIEKNNKTLVGHLGEPKNCWLPLSQMTVKNDREYFAEHPEYHMFLHPEYPSYEDQVAARDHVLQKHPGLRFDGAHLGSLEWSVDELAKHLDQFPNLAVDMAERISHLQYQTLKDHQKVYDFFVKYQDRILYATDMVIDDSISTEKVLNNAHDIWTNHWKFFTSDQTMAAPEVDGKFKALHLPKEVVDKIYRKNAEKWFPGILQ